MRGENPNSNPTRFKSFVLFFFLNSRFVDMYGLGLYFISIHETDFDWLKEWKIILFWVTSDF